MRSEFWHPPFRGQVPNTNPVQGGHPVTVARFRCLMLVACLALLLPSPARADIDYYTFFDMTCDPASHSLSLSISPLRRDELPEDRAQQIRDGTLRNTFIF